MQTQPAAPHETHTGFILIRLTPEATHPGLRNLLQLAKRFGPLPEWVLARLSSARREQLEAWAERIFDVATLEQFFE